MMTFIPPLTLEVVRRRRPRVWVLKAELNSQVYNDLGGQMLPPFYEYGDGMDIQFKELALYHLSGMRRRGYPLSTNCWWAPLASQISSPDPCLDPVPCLGFACMHAYLDSPTVLSGAFQM